MGNNTSLKLEKGINSRTNKVHWANRVPHPSPKQSKSGATILVQVCGPESSRVPLDEANSDTAISCGRCTKKHGPGDIEVKRTAPKQRTSPENATQEETSNKECPACQQEVAVRPSGRMAPHKFAGERCDGKAPEIPATKPASIGRVGEKGQQRHVKPTQTQPQRSNRDAPTPTHRSHAKALKFAESVEAMGWAAEVNPATNDSAQVMATRNNEVITIEWVDNRTYNGGQSYTDPNGRTVILRNASAALQVAGRSEQTAKEEAARKATAKRRVGRPRKHSQAGSLPPDEVPGASLPFSKDSMPHEIMEAIVGRAIEWHNNMSGKVQSALVLPTPKNSIKPDRNGNQVVHFLSPEGFCAVRVSAIRSVGNKQVETPTAEQRADRAEQRLQTRKAKATVKRK